MVVAPTGANGEESGELPAEALCEGGRGERGGLKVIEIESFQIPLLARGEEKRSARKWLPLSRAARDGVWESV